MHFDHVHPPDLPITSSRPPPALLYKNWQFLEGWLTQKYHQGWMLAPRLTAVQMTIVIKRLTEGHIIHNN